MATPIRIPAVGQTASDVTVISWLRAAGDRVAAGDPVAIVETDKTEIEVESPSDGIIGVLRLREGDSERPGTLMVYVLGEGEAEPSAAPVSPRARTLAAEHGLDLADAVGSGPSGLITERDVAALLERRSEPPVAGRAYRQRRPLPAVRRVAARRLSDSWVTAPHFVQMIDADMTAAQAHLSAGVGYTELVVAAVARALAEHPHLNATYDNGDLVEWSDINIGVAVDTPRGLLVPVVTNADRHTPAQLGARVRELADRARAGTLTAAELRYGSATVSNLGRYGVRAGTAVLNSPEAVLIFVGTVEPRPVVREGQVVVRDTATLSFTFDHRVVDGAPAAAFARSVVAALEGETLLAPGG